MTTIELIKILNEEKTLNYIDSWNNEIIKIDLKPLIEVRK